MCLMFSYCFLNRLSNGRPVWFRKECLPPSPAAPIQHLLSLLRHFGHRSHHNTACHWKLNSSFSFSFKVLASQELVKLKMIKITSNSLSS